MVKQIVAGILCVLLSSSLYARDDISESKSFIGIEVGAATIEANNIFLGDNYEGSGVEFGIRLGAQNQQWRTLIALNYYDNTDDDQEYFKGIVTFDYLLIQDTPLQPYLGVNVGYIDYTSDAMDDTGFLYGGQAGVLYSVTENIQMDVSYRYSIAETDNVNHVGGIIVGLNYIF